MLSRSGPALLVAAPASVLVLAKGAVHTSPGAPLCATGRESLDWNRQLITRRRGPERIEAGLATRAPVSTSRIAPRASRLGCTSGSRIWARFARALDRAMRQSSRGYEIGETGQFD